MLMIWRRRRDTKWTIATRALLFLAAVGLLCGGSARTLTQSSDNGDVVDEQERGGFLEQDLPLAIISTTPASLSSYDSETIEAQDDLALTVVFSRPVIALGQDFGTKKLPNDKTPFTLTPNIPGRFQWVTTYIARWDPEKGWPLDMDVEFQWNQNLTTHDGLPLVLKGHTDGVTITTPSLKMEYGGVTSKRAENLTEGEWSPSEGLSTDKLPEVPPDGVIELKFNTDVSMTALGEHIKILDGDLVVAKKLKPVARPCKKRGKLLPGSLCPNCEEDGDDEKSPEESNCAEVTIKGDLGVGELYYLSLPEGTEYSKKDGPLKRDIVFSFGGLREFKIPFHADRSWRASIRDQNTVKTRTLSLWLPHGLKNGEKDLKKFRKQITIVHDKDDEKKIEFDLSMKKKGILRIFSTDLLPENIYRVTVEASDSILDGFDLPLQASAIRVKALTVKKEVLPMETNSGFAIFEADQDWGRKIVAFSKGERRVWRGCPKDGPLIGVFELPEKMAANWAFSMLHDRWQKTSLSERMGQPPSAELKNDGTDKIGAVSETNITELLGAAGMVAYEQCHKKRHGSYIVMESYVQAMVVGSGTDTSTVWVTSMKSGEPIEGAKVTALRTLKKARESAGPEDFDVVTEAVTDKDGKAEIGSESGLRVHVQYKDGSLLIDGLSNGYFKEKDRTNIELILDRRLVRPGETLHIKGYALHHDGKSWKPSSKENLTLTIHPSVSSGGKGKDVFPIEVDEKFGTFEFRIPVAGNSTLGTGFVTVGDRRRTAVSDDFFVGDPRPPTVGLTLETPVWARPDSRIEVELTAESFIGASVDHADISLAWSVSGEDLTGEMEVLSDESGKAFATIDLGALEKSPPPGSTLTIDATWVGPTRELIVESTSVKLEMADVVVSLIRTAQTNIPGQEFGVEVSLADLQGVELESRSVDVQLKKLPELPPGEDAPPNSARASEPLEGEEVESCSIESDANDWCRLKLPSLGNFAVEACVMEGDKNATVCAREFLGRTLSEWADRGPWDNHLEMGLMMLSEGPFKVGDTVEFGIENPYANARAFVSWGSSLGTEHQMIALDDFGLSEFSVELGEICTFNCGVTVGIAIPRQTEGLAFAQSEVPVSKLFDLAAPHFVRLSATIEVEQDAAMDVRIPFPLGPPDQHEALEFVVRPGESETIKVEVDTSEEVEVTVIAVDKALLELAPVALKDLADEFLVEFQGEFGLRVSDKNLVSPKAIQALVDDFLERKELHPWFSPSTGLLADSWTSNRLDFTREEFLDAVHEFITKAVVVRNDFRDSSEGRALFADGTFQTKSVLGSGASGGEDGSTITARLQEHFVSTPLFETTTTKNGIAEVNFTAPENLGTFIIRAYASTGSGKFGQAQAELIVRREVSLTPSAPRFVRVGDEFEAGAVVTVSGARSAAPTVTVNVSLDGKGAKLLEIVDKNEVSVEMGEDSTSEVRFRFKAKSMGAASLKITADDMGSGDALVINFPIEGLQEAVVLASSFAIDGSNSSSWQEGIQLPDAVAGSGGVNIQAGVGRLPSILSLAKEIYTQNPAHECPVHAGYALALAAIPFVTESYGVMGLPRNDLEQGSADMLDGMISNFTAALKTLEAITSEEFGLQYALTCPSSKLYSEPEEPSVWENARAAWIVMELGEDIRDSFLEDVQEGIISLVELQGTWLKVLEETFVSEAEEYQFDYRTPMAIDMVALTRAALGKSWNVPPWVSPLVVDDLSLERLSRNLASLSVESQAYYVLTLLAIDPVDHHPDVKKAIDAWMSNFRVTGRSGYVAASQGSSTPAANVANSLVLMAMNRAGVSNPLIEKLANYVGGPPVGAYGFRVFSNFDKVTAMIALRDYDRSRGSTLPNISLNVRSGKVELMKASFDQNSNPVQSTTTPWEDLDSPPKPLEFTAEGTGQVTLAASLEFIPKKLLPFPTYKGIFLERAIRVPESNGPSLKKVPVGSILDIVVQLTTPDQLGLTTVRAMMPAGLEPVDPNADGSRVCAIPQIEDGGAESDRFSAFEFDFRSVIFTCPNQETRPSVVTFDFEYVNAGTVTITFRAVAATAGTFALPPVRAFVGDQPEVMGLSSAGELVVCTRCVAEEDALPKVPKSCPNDCSDNGACNLNLGECVCLSGFTGDDCGKLVAT